MSKSVRLFWMDTFCHILEDVACATMDREMARSDATRAHQQERYLLSTTRRRMMLVLHISAESVKRLQHICILDARTLS